MDLVSSRPLLLILDGHKSLKFAPHTRTCTHTCTSNRWTRIYHSRHGKIHGLFFGISDYEGGCLRFQSITKNDDNYSLIPKREKNASNLTFDLLTGCGLSIIRKEHKHGKGDLAELVEMAETQEFLFGTASTTLAQLNCIRLYCILYIRLYCIRLTTT